MLFNLYIPENVRLQNFFLNFRALDILVQTAHLKSVTKTSTLCVKLLCFKDLFLVLYPIPILRFKLPKMAILKFPEKKLIKKFTIYFPRACCLFPKSISKRKLLINNFKLP